MVTNRAVPPSSALVYLHPSRPCSLSPLQSTNSSDSLCVDRPERDRGGTHGHRPSG